MSSQQVLRRLGESNHFVGVRWIYLDSKLEPLPREHGLLGSSFDVRRGA